MKLCSELILIFILNKMTDLSLGTSIKQLNDADTDKNKLTDFYSK